MTQEEADEHVRKAFLIVRKVLRTNAIGRAEIYDLETAEQHLANAVLFIQKRGAKR